MKIEEIPIKCNGKIHTVIKYHLDFKDPILLDSLAKGAKLAGKVDIRDPSGIPRSIAKRVAKCSGGVLAEKIFYDFLEKRMANQRKKREELSNVELFVPPADYSKGQTDLVLRLKDSKEVILTIEIRSSFSYITPSIENVVRYAMSLLGPYTTTVKPYEELKDFYVTVIHRVNPALLVVQSKRQGIESYIVGGGSREMFQDSTLTSVDDLYQEGAEYKIIKPICMGLDANAVVNEIIMQIIRLP